MAVAIAGMSASSLHAQPAPPPNPAVLPVAIALSGEAEPVSKSQENTLSAADAEALPIEPTEWRGSLLFGPATIAKLRQAISYYQPGGASETAGSDFLSDLSASPVAAPQEIIVQAPYFYLGSVISTPQGEWYIWLNGKRYAASHPLDDARLDITRIGSGAVTFAWKPDAAAEIRENWRQRQEHDAARHRTSRNVSYDETENTVTFTLKPNQTFFSETMQVREGRISPRAVPVKVTNASAMPPTAQPGRAAAPDNTATSRTVMAAPASAAPAPDAPAAAGAAINQTAVNAMNPQAQSQSNTTTSATTQPDASGAGVGQKAPAKKGWGIQRQQMPDPDNIIPDTQRR